MASFLGLNVFQYASLQQMPLSRLLLLQPPAVHWNAEQFLKKSGKKLRDKNSDSSFWNNFCVLLESFPLLPVAFGEIMVIWEDTGQWKLELWGKVSVCLKKRVGVICKNRPISTWCLYRPISDTFLKTKRNKFCQATFKTWLPAKVESVLEVVMRKLVQRSQTKIIPWGRPSWISIVLYNEVVDRMMDAKIGRKCTKKENRQLFLADRLKTITRGCDEKRFGFPKGTFCTVRFFWLLNNH